MTGSSGTCYVNDVVYDCGKDVKVDTVQSDTTYKCNGIACLGEECINVDRTYSTDFAKINALLNALQQMGQDMSCTGLDEDGKTDGRSERFLHCFRRRSWLLQNRRRRLAGLL